MANDQDTGTKWCVTSGQSQTPWLEYTFDRPMVITRWMMLRAAAENGNYVPRAFTLQYQNESGAWVDADAVTGNALNKCLRPVSAITTQAVRLQMVQGEQEGYTTRIYEFAVYGHPKDETAIGSIAAGHKPTGRIYDLQGRQVLNPTRGIYIRDGKKVLMK